MPAKQQIKPGDYYMDCSYHPVLCTAADGYTLEGISLIDGSSPRSCSLINCRPRKLTFKAALRLKFKGPSPARKKKLDALKRQGWTFQTWW